MSDDEILKIEMLLHILGDCNTNLAKEEELIENNKLEIIIMNYSHSFAFLHFL